MTPLFLALAALAAGVLFNYLGDVLPFLDDDEEADIAPPSPDEENPFRAEAQRAPSIYALLAGGRVRHPKAAPPWRYPIVELATVAVSLFVWFTLDASATMRVIKASYLIFFVLIILIDMEHKLILTITMIPAFIFALVETLFTGRISMLQALAGYALGQIIFLSMYLFGQLYVWFVNQRRAEKINTVAFGYGDVTLGTFCGLLVGPMGVVSLVTLTVLIGGISAMGYLALSTLLKGRDGVSAAIPYGPSIALAAALVLLYGSDVAMRIL